MKNTYNSILDVCNNQNIEVYDNHTKDTDTFDIKDIITDGFCS